MMISVLACVSGCAFQVGKDEFGCPNDSEGAACSSARQIYELTNNRDSLEGLYVSKGKIIPNKAEAHGANENKTTAKHSPSKTSNNVIDDVYVPLSHKRYDQYPPAELIETEVAQENPTPGITNEHGKLMRQHQAPEALAPEPLAILQPAKNMRILMAPWKDKDGALHMPSYVFVEVEAKKWIVGEQANFRPARVVPLQVKQRSKQETKRQKRASLGVSSLGIGTK